MNGIKDVKIESFLKKLLNFNKISNRINLKINKPILITFELKSKFNSINPNNISILNKTKYYNKNNKFDYKYLINDIFNCLSKNFNHMNKNLSPDSSYISILIINENYNSLFNFFSTKDFENIESSDLKYPIYKKKYYDIILLVYLYNGKNIKKNLSILTVNLILELEKLIEEKNFIKFLLEYIKINSKKIYEFIPNNYRFKLKEIENHLMKQVNVKKYDIPYFTDFFDLIESDFWKNYEVKKKKNEEPENVKLNLSQLNKEINKNLKLEGISNKNFRVKNELIQSKIRKKKKKSIKRVLNTERLMKNRKSIKIKKKMVKSKNLSKKSKIIKKTTNNKDKTKNLKLDLNDINSYEIYEKNLKIMKNNDINSSNRRMIKLEIYSDELSLVYKDFLFISNFKIASNIDFLNKYKITHIINCAGDYSDNQLSGFIYKILYLKDSKQENIECFFYDIYNYINLVINNYQNSKILIHCVQGISRSVTLATSYIMIKEKKTYGEAYEIIRKKRPVASPNLGFHYQLELFNERLFNNNNLQINNNLLPKIFVIGSFQKERPDILKAKLVYDEKFYELDTKKNYNLDSRGCFLIQNKKNIYIWIGSDCERIDESWEMCSNYITFLKEYEGGESCIGVFYQNKETKDFWDNFPNYKNFDKNELYNFNNNFNNLFPKNFLLFKQNNNNLISFHSNTYRKNEKIKKDELFIFPDFKNVSKIFDIEDLKSDNFVVLCLRNNIACIWKGINFDNKFLNDSQNFISLVINNYYKKEEIKKLEIIEEIFGDETDHFIGYFK